MFLNGRRGTILATLPWTYSKILWPVADKYAPLRCVARMSHSSAIHAHASSITHHDKTIGIYIYHRKPASLFPYAIAGRRAKPILLQPSPQQPATPAHKYTNPVHAPSAPTSITIIVSPPNRIVANALICTYVEYR